MRHIKSFFVICFMLALVGAEMIFELDALGQDIKARKPAGQESASAQGPESRRDRARDLYYLADKSGEVRYTGLRMRLYQADEQCNFVQVSPFKTFRSGEAIRFAVESNISGFVYIIARGSSGQTKLLFPNKDLNNGANQLYRGTELMIPGREWFRFDDMPGVETVSIILTRRKLDLLPHLLPGAEGPTVPSSGVEASVLDILRGRVRSRDLIYTPDEEIAPPAFTSSAVNNSFYAVNSTATGNEYCVLQIKLNHK